MVISAIPIIQLLVLLLGADYEIKNINISIVDQDRSAADEHHSDLVIMGTLGETGLRDKIFGSISSGIIGKINIPVMAVPLMSE